MDLPTVWYIQMKVCIGIRPLRSVENDKLFALIQLGPLLRLSHDIMNRGSNGHMPSVIMRLIHLNFGGINVQQYSGVSL